MHHTQTHSEIHKATKSILEFLQFRRLPLVFCHDLQQLHRVQQVVQGIGAVPELMLTPEAGSHREEGQLVNIRRFGRKKGRRAAQEVRPPSGKKSCSVQASTSWVRRKQVIVSNSSSGRPQQPSLNTGMPPAGSRISA